MRSLSARVVLILALSVMSLSAGDVTVATAPGWREIELPVLARVTSTDPTGQMWRELGVCRGAYEAVCAEFRACLQRQGWVLDMAIPMGNAEAPSRLVRWRRDGRVLIVMLWDKGVAQCGFAWGYET